MSIEQILVIALVQGLTEFLPVSSSGHLILVPAFTGWKDQGIVTDVMVHVGSLFAVLVYFRKDVTRLWGGLITLLSGRVSEDSRMTTYILLATIPALVFGAFLKFSGISAQIRGVEIVAWNAIIFGVLLYAADKYGPRLKAMTDITLSPAMLIGLAQALALIPGVSRSGITITAARSLGFKRNEAARFSFLLGIPAITVAGLFTALEALQQGHGIPVDALWTAFLTFFAALAAIAGLMAVVKRTSFLVFVIYRLVLAFVLFAMLYDWFPGFLPSITN
ncbi:MAG: undecaprenyl-diphosphate phosphatase [Hyphomicrobiales bacterium]|nr:MAG: undecaprenyl-diphosphate phosphatase [Hyphomicrobiales bacterium]